MNKPLWPIQTQIQPDELLSSWLIRTSLENGSDPMTWSWYFWGKWRAWTIDIDRKCEESKLAAISFNQFDQNTLRNATLTPYIEATLTKPLADKAAWPWLIPLGSRNRDRSNQGLRFCPECLKEKTPYFKRDWRMAWTHSCPKHNTVLLNHCPKCSHAITPHLVTQDNPDICTCSRCGFDLRASKTAISDSKAIRVQELLNDVFFNKATRQLPWGIRNASDFIHTTRNIMSFLLMCYTDRTQYKNHHEIGMALSFPSEKNIITNAATIERIPPTLMLILAKSLHMLMEMNIKDLVSFFQAHGVTQSQLRNRFTFPAPTFEFIIDQMCESKKSGRGTNSKPKSIKPRSKDEVLKMWQSIQRYL